MGVASLQFSRWLKAVACRDWLTRGATLDCDGHICTLPGCRAAHVDRVLRRRIGGVDTRANLRRLCGRHTKIKETNSSKPKRNCDGKPYLRGCDETAEPLNPKGSSAPNFALRQQDEAVGHRHAITYLLLKSRYCRKRGVLKNHMREITEPVPSRFLLNREKKFNFRFPTTADKAGFWRGIVCPLMTVVSTGRRNTLSWREKGVYSEGSAISSRFRSGREGGAVKSLAERGSRSNDRTGV